MAAEVISIQNGSGMLTSSIRRVHGVRTKVGRLRKHRNLIGFAEASQKLDRSFIEASQKLDRSFTKAYSAVKGQIGQKLDRSSTSTLHPPHIHPTSTLHPPYIHPTSTSHPPDSDLTSTCINGIKMKWREINYC